MSSEKQIKIMGGEEAKQGLENRALIHLTNRVNKLERGDVVGQLRHAIATRIHQLVANGKTKHLLMDNIDSAFGPIEHMKGLRERGDIAIAKDGKKTVGMVGFERCGELKGRNVYEIRRMTVRKKYEGQFISLQLYKAILERLQATDSNALILVDSQNPVVSKQCKRMGYAPCTALEGLTIKYGKERASEWVTSYEERGGRFFLYDPSKPKGSDAVAEEVK